MVLILGISAVSAEEDSPIIGNGDDYTFDALNEKIIGEPVIGELNLYNCTWEGQSNPIELTPFINVVNGGYPNEMGTLDGRTSTYILKISADCNVVINNVCFINGKTNGNGGAVYIEEGANVTFVNCKFVKNTANNGGAIYGSDFTLVNCEFINNTAKTNGGAVYVKDGATLSTSTFSGNSAPNGGAVYASDEVLVKYSHFNKNVAQNAGGAIAANNVTVISSTFNANSARTSGGGAISTKNLLVKYSTFENNDALYGGAIAALSNLNQVNIPSGSIVNSLFVDNNANDGPGADIYYAGELIVSNSSFASANSQGGANIFVPAEGILLNENNAFISNLHGTNNDSNIVINVENIAGTDKAKVLIYVPIGATGDVFLALNTQKLKTFTLTNGKSKYVEEIDNIVYGLNDVVARYLGDSNFVIGAQSVEFNKTHKRDVDININIPEVSYGEDAEIEITSSIDGPFELTIGNEKQTITLVNGRKTITVSNLNAGGYPVIVKYAGDAVTNAKTVSEMLIVNKLQSSLDVDVVISDISVTLNIRTNAKSVEVYVDGKYYCDVAVKSGSASKILELPSLNEFEGTYSVNVVTNDLNYFVSEVTKEFSTDYKYGLYVSEIDTFVGNPAAELNAKVLDREGNPVRGADVLITIVGEDGSAVTWSKSTGPDGTTPAIDLKNFKPGVYNVTAKFAGQKKSGYLYTTSQIVIYDLIEHEEEMTVNSSEKFEYSVKLVDQQNNPQKGITVTFTVDGKNYTAVTDNEGVAKVNLTLATPGEHNITVSATFPPKPHADPELYEVTYVIDVLPPEMDSLVVTSSVTNNNAVITATLGKTAPGDIIFNVNDVEYVVAITGKIATLTLNNLENGQYRVHASLNSPKYANITNTTLFRVNYEQKEVFIGANPVIIIYETPNNPFVVRIVDEFYNPLVNVDVVITVDGNKYSKKTDSQGSTSISTNKMNIGYYPVTVEFKGGQSYPASTVDSYIEILPVILSSLQLTTAVDCNDVVITAKLNQKVNNGVMVFTVDGQNYTQDVNVDTAVLILQGLEKGTYDVVATFKSTDYSEISNSTSFTITGMRGAVNLNTKNVTMDYGENKYLEIRALDDWGFVIVGLDLEIKLGNLTFHQTTDDEGSVFLPLSKVNGGDYNVNVTFKGNDDYGPASTTGHVVINPITMDSMAVTSTVHYEHAVITVTLPKDVGAGDLVFNVNGEDQTVPITGKTATLDLTNLEKGQYTVLVTLNSPNYDQISNFTTFDVVATRSAVNIETSNVTMSYTENKYLEATLTDKNGQAIENIEVIVKIADMEIPTTTDANGKISIPLNKLSGGIYSATIKFNGSEEYAAAVADVLITVNPIKMDSMDITTAVDKQTATITITLSQDVGTGNITLDINGRTQIVPVTGKTATVTLDNLAEGTYNVKATLNSPNFEAITNNAQFVISLARPLVITVGQTNVYWSGTVPIYVKEGNGKAVSGVSIKISINGSTPKSYKTNSNGRINLGTSDLKVINTDKPNPYLFKLVYDGSEYDYTSENVTVNILSTIEASNLVKYFRNDSQFEAKVFDKNGKPITEGVKVSIVVNGGSYERGVKENGLIVFNINLDPGVYLVTVTNPSTKQVSNFNVTVLSNMKPFNFKDEFTIYYRNGTPFRLTLLDDHGVPMKGVLVTMNINGVFYNRTTKDDGAITFNINLLPGKYILTAMRYADGHELFRSYIVNILSPVIGQSISMSASNRKPFTATILDGQGKPYIGHQVRMNINGVFYYRTTTVENQGKISLNINLMPASYILTVYMDCDWALDSSGTPIQYAHSFDIVVRND